MIISTYILGCRNSAYTSHILATHPYSSFYKLSPIIILVDVYNATGDNDSIKSTIDTCMYPLTKFLDLVRINPSGY